MNKSAISLAVASALGLGVSAANAASVAITGMTIEDVGSNTSNTAGAYTAVLDGISGAFQFKNNYINVGSYNGATPWTGDVGDMNAGANGTGSFSTGFLFSGSPFVPFTYGSGFQGTVDTTANTVNITSLDFGGNYNGGADFLLPPDSNFPLEVLWVNPVGGGDYTVAFRWGHDITSTEDPSLGFTAFTAQWVIEGTIHTSAVPVPAAVWLFGSGLLGLVGVARRRKGEKV